MCQLLFFRQTTGVCVHDASTHSTGVCACAWMAIVYTFSLIQVLENGWFNATSSRDVMRRKESKEVL